MRHALPHYRHLFPSDSCAAGYDVYQWAEVLDADAFEARRGGRPVRPATAERLLRHVYAVGDAVEPRASYRAFCRCDPAVGPMLARRGLLAEPV